MANPAPTVAFHTLGCKLNFSESSSLSRMLREQGYRAVPFDKQADVYVINTCSVTDNADRKCRAVVRKALRKSPDAFVVVVGCYAQLKPAEIAGIEGVDLVLGAAEKFRLAEFLNDLTRSGQGKKKQGEYQCGEIAAHEHFIPSWSSVGALGERTRCFLKVQDGCDYNCSFCTIPLARGRSRSDRIDAVVERVSMLANSGVREIVLTGINLGDFGISHSTFAAESRTGSPTRREDFFGLVRTLDRMEVDLRFRISSIEPNLLSPEIIDFLAGSQRFVPHFHVPLQSGCDTILALMRRRYRTKLYAERVHRIKQALPDAAIGVDVIVGFPGEGETEFLETCEFLIELPVSYLHVFPYSERNNTLAAGLPRAVAHEERLRRSNILRALSEKKRRAFYQACQGQVRPVLFEGSKKNGLTYGFSDNYVKVQIQGAEWSGKLLPVRLAEVDSQGSAVNGSILSTPVVN